MPQLVQIGRPTTGRQGFFRHRAVGDRVLLTNREGDFVVLSAADFQAFARDDIPPGSELENRLIAGNFLRDRFDAARAVEQQRLRKSFLTAGPNLHILVVTLRCNETCVYCHSSRATLDARDSDMSFEVAEKSVDLALRSSNPSITFEFQGGEPLVNFDVVRHTIEYALAQNATARKTLEFTLVSNLSLMTDEILGYLLDHRVQICTSVDGPQPLHDRQRRLPGLSAHDRAVHWIHKVNDAYVARGLDPRVYHVEALLTTTRHTLPLWREVIDTYVSLGCKSLFLRPLDPFGFADRTAGVVEYPRREYLEFYRRSLDYILALNASGTEILERYASIFLTKILGGEDPNYLDIRSPCGAGIGQVAYNYDGRVYTCDEGRMLHEAGDDTFQIGDVHTSTYTELMAHPTVRALLLASNLDAVPDCVNCAYQPYCGVCPVVNHKTQGTIFGRMRENTLCAVHKGIQDYLFEKIAEANPETMATFRRWITVRSRAHFLQGPHEMSSRGGHAQT